MAAVLVCHMLALLAAALWLDSEHQGWQLLEFVLFNFCVMKPVMLLLAIIAAAVQVTVAQRAPAVSALSTAAIKSQAVLYTLLAIAWLFRMPALDTRDEWDAILWYPLQGWPCVNNALLAVQQVVILVVIEHKAPPDAAAEDEGRPSLAA